MMVSKFGISKLPGVNPLFSGASGQAVSFRELRGLCRPVLLTSRVATFYFSQADRILGRATPILRKQESALQNPDTGHLGCLAGI